MNIKSFCGLLVGLGALPACLAANAKSSPSAADSLRSIAVGDNPESVARGFDGQYFVTLMGAQRAKGDGDGKIVAVNGTKVSTLATGFDDPKGIVFTGTELITADFDHVWAIDAKGKKRVLAGPGAFPKPPLFLNDVALAPDGRSVYVTDMGARDKMLAGPGKLWPLGTDEARKIPAVGRVYRVTLDGRVSVAIDSDAKMPIPNGVTSLPDGTLCVAEFFLGTLLEWRSGKWRQIGADFRSCDGIVPDGKGNFYVTEVFTGQVWRVKQATGERTLLTTLQSAADLMLDQAPKQLVIPDTKAGKIVFLPL